MHSPGCGRADPFKLEPSRPQRCRRGAIVRPMDTTHDLLAEDGLDEARPEAPPAPIDDGLNASRGIVLSMVLGGGLWIILLTVGWLIFR